MTIPRQYAPGMRARSCDFLLPSRPLSPRADSGDSSWNFLGFFYLAYRRLDHVGVREWTIKDTSRWVANELLCICVSLRGYFTLSDDTTIVCHWHASEAVRFLVFTHAHSVTVLTTETLWNILGFFMVSTEGQITSVGIGEWIIKDTFKRGRQ